MPARYYYNINIVVYTLEALHAWLLAKTILDSLLGIETMSSSLA